MIKILNINDSKLNEITQVTLSKETAESTTYLFVENGRKKVFKRFKDKINIDNKVKKICLLNERLKNINFVVTAESIIKHNGKIIGYTMPYIQGNIFDCLTFNKNDSILILKDISKKLKILHSLGIICSDIIGNIMIDSDKKVYFIDHDNFSIDKLPVETKNIFLKEYERITKSFDHKFDNYEFNLFTLTILTKISPMYLKLQYTANPKYFNFRDKVIRQITENTLHLTDDTYNEQLIVDQINSKSDLKKIKLKKF